MSFDKKNNIFDAKTKKELEKRESKYLKKINNIKNFFNLDKFESQNLDKDFETYYESEFSLDFKKINLDEKPITINENNEIKNLIKRIEEVERKIRIFDNLKRCTITIDPDYYNKITMKMKKNMRGNVIHQNKIEMYFTNIISYNQQS